MRILMRSQYLTGGIIRCAVRNSFAEPAYTKYSSQGSVPLAAPRDKRGGLIG